MNSPENKPDPDARTSRLMCYLASAVFLGCGVLLWLAPMEMHIAARAVGAGFNVIIALAVFLYGRQL